MPEYVIAPQEPPAWRFEPEDFLRRIRERWPKARTGISSDPDDRMATEALIPFDEPPGELGVALNNQGYAVYLDPAEPENAAEFAIWYIRQLPVTQAPVHLFTMDFEINIELRLDTTVDEVHAFLSGDIEPGTA